MPIDSVSDKYAEEQSKAETQRALGDLQRQQNLGFNTQHHSIPKQSQTTPTLVPQTPLHSEENSNAQAPSLTTDKQTNNDSEQHSIAEVNNDFVFYNETDETTHLPQEQTDTFKIEDNAPLQEAEFPKFTSDEDEKYTLTEVDQNSLAHEWFDFGERHKK